MAARGGTVAATGRRAIRDKGAPGDYKILTTSEGPYRLARFSPARPKLGFFRRFASPSTSESYECTIGIRRKRQKHRRGWEKERWREAAAVVPLRESRIAIVIAVTCAMHGEKYRRVIKVPPIPAESFLRGRG